MKRRAQGRGKKSKASPSILSYFASIPNKDDQRIPPPPRPPPPQPAAIIVVDSSSDDDDEKGGIGSPRCSKRKAEEVQIPCPRPEVTCDRAVGEEEEGGDCPERPSNSRPPAPKSCNCSFETPWSQFDPMSACFTGGKDGKSAPFHHLSRSLDLIAGTTKRLEKERIFVNLIRSLLALSPGDVYPCIAMSSNYISTGFGSVSLGVGGGLVSRALREATGVSRDDLRRKYRATGDLGDAAQSCRSSQTLLYPPPALSIQEVFNLIVGLSQLKGERSDNNKKIRMVKLLRSCRDGSEVKFIVRILIQNVRTGFTLTSILSAMAVASCIHREGVWIADNDASALLKMAKDSVSKCYHRHPDLCTVVGSLVTGGVNGMLENCVIKPLTPIVPMLAKPIQSINEIVDKIGDSSLLLEYKYDGCRCQVHIDSHGSVKLFSRNLEDITSNYSDVAESLSHCGCTSPVILDAEVVGVDHNGNLLPFQEISKSPKTCLYAFDMLYDLSGPLVDKSLIERRKTLEHWLSKYFPSEAYENERIRPVYLATSLSVSQCETSKGDLEENVSNFIKKSLCAGAEGLMCKVMNAVYEPGARSSHWNKLKKDYMDGHDTFDLVPIGAWRGNGRKSSWLSPILMAVYDSEREELQSFCRVMSGFSDEFYREITAFYSSSERVVDRPPAYVVTGEQCSVWFAPCEVWEVRGADITVSPVHRAAWSTCSDGRGLGLRFPRFVRKRPDKTTEEATLSSMVAERFSSQAVRHLHSVKED